MAYQWVLEGHLGNGPSVGTKRSPELGREHMGSSNCVIGSPFSLQRRLISESVCKTGAVPTAGGREAGETIYLALVARVT